MNKWENLRIDKAEALRYLGYRGKSIDENTSRLAEQCIDEIKQLARPGRIYRIFELEREPGGLRLAGTGLVLRGEAIAGNLRNAEKCALLAVTLGGAIDGRILYYEKIDLTKALIFDACAAAACEALCDAVQEELDGLAVQMGLRANARFSPGYGDLSLDIQRNIINILNAYNTIGLAATESCLLTPRKSVTAFAGFVKDHDREDCRGCGACEKHDKCLFRKD